jgi:hypothetical protein
MDLGNFSREELLAELARREEVSKLPSKEVQPSAPIVKRKKKYTTSDAPMYHTTYDSKSPLDLLRIEHTLSGKANFLQIHTFIAERKIAIEGGSIPSLTKNIADYFHGFIKFIGPRYKAGFGNPILVMVSMYVVKSEKGDKTDYRRDTFRNISESEISAKLTELSNKHLGTNYNASVNSFQMYIDRYEDQGGCNLTKKTQTQTKVFNTDTEKACFLSSYSSKDNNCAFAIFKHHTPIKEKARLQYNTARNNIGFPINQMVDIDQLHCISLYYDVPYILCNASGKIIRKREGNNPVTIVLMDNHYYEAEFIDMIQDIQCPTCTEWHPSNVKHACKVVCPMCNRSYRYEHSCDKNRVSYFNGQVLGKKFRRFERLLSKDYILEEQKLDPNDVVHLYVKSFKVGDQTVPYICSYILNGFFHCYKGENCLQKFIEVSLTWKNKVIHSFNGSSNAFHHLMRVLNENKIRPENILFFNNKFMTMTYGDGLKLIDLKLFVNKGLGQSCRAFGSSLKSEYKFHKCPETKEDWDIVRTHVKKNNYCVKKLFDVFCSTIYETFKVNVSKFVSISQLSYNVALRYFSVDVSDKPNNGRIIQELLDETKTAYVKMGTYGARCGPLKKEFVSNWCDRIASGEKVSYEEVLKSKDYLFIGDVASLYPASMTPTQVSKPEFGIGASRWSEDGETEFKNNKWGYYTVSYKANKTLRIAIVPNKRNGGTKWDLIDSTGVYTGEDIKNMISNGYEVTFDGTCLVWDESIDYKFSRYLNFVYGLKLNATNSVHREIAKLMCNSLYGKNLQMGIDGEYRIVNDVKQYRDLQKKYYFADIDCVADSVWVYVVKKDTRLKTTKPIQNGGYILAYSRSIMLNYFKRIDPTLTTTVFYNTDTDSMHITGIHHQMLVNDGVIVDKKKANMGQVCNDLDNDAIILYEKNLGPKNYMITHIDKNNVIQTTMKCKGIPRDQLNPKMYVDEKGVVKFDSTRKNGFKGKNKFQIKKTEMTRTMNFNRGDGYNEVTKEWYPLK